ncbi:hypothetical protein [Limnofasciculus baicalensis]|uniref:LlaJI family restriction endonuclease n=1 Tax=Limnofasciculus baicalensis BBK-W-15 TaxID=2699891 RepID=A0AAE3H0A1_9CYAN|nr:hypothetical protein [Limnofasciculus baicalensis]MCP2731887.1 hypothetical protein [Limnofasciculus baicalensis BBK-W-15]
MFDFNSLKLIKGSNDFFVGIRKSISGDSFEFCLPNGFDNFPEGDFDSVRDLFFKMYRTFRKFEHDNIGTSRFNRNTSEYQRDQDQTTLSSEGVSIETEEGEVCVLYSKIKMIEQVLEAYDDLAINSIQKKVRRSEDIDYSQIHKYLDRAIYLDKDVIYVDAIDLPRPTMRYESTDIVNLYCYVLDEIVQQLQADIPENIKARSQDIRFLAQRFKDNYLSSNQSIFDKDTFAETINILKESLDNIDKNTYYKDTDYWGLYEAIEIFLYGEINPSQNDGNYWGMRGFSLLWEDMCHTYFFKNHREEICYADTDISLKGYQNNERQGEDQNRVGNYKPSGRTWYWNQWIYRKISDIPKYPRQHTSESFGWDELLCIEFDLQPGTLVYSNRDYGDLSKRDRSKSLRRFPRPDLVLNKDKEIKIIDYKDVALEFYTNPSSSQKSANKYKDDIIKQLTYELAIQQTHTIYDNQFFIPYYYKLDTNPEFLGEIEPNLNLKGIKIFKANFLLIQKTYLEENL